MRDRDVMGFVCHLNHISCGFGSTVAFIFCIRVLFPLAFMSNLIVLPTVPLMIAIDFT